MSFTKAVTSFEEKNKGVTSKTTHETLLIPTYLCLILSFLKVENYLPHLFLVNKAFYNIFNGKTSINAFTSIIKFPKMKKERKFDKTMISEYNKPTFMLKYRYWHSEQFWNHYAYIISSKLIIYKQYSLKSKINSKVAFFQNIGSFVCK